jgi:hypothetical protein
MKNKIAGLCRFLFSVMGALAVSGCSWESTITDKSTGLSSLSACSPDQILSGQCAADAGQIVTSTMGSNVTSWSNAGSGTTVISSISDGYYQSKQCSFEDLDLTPANIANGINVFGVLGTASGPYAACTDDVLNAAQCSTAASRYVYTAAYGGRNATCSAGLNAAACWTNAINQYTTSTAGANVNGADGSLSATIPSGYYAGTETATMSDTDLVAGNIRTGITLFGVNGTLSFSHLTASSALRDPGVKVIPNLTDLATTSAQLTLNNENTLYAGADLPTTGGYNYRDVPSMAVDDEGYYGTNCKYAPRPSSNCGTSQATLALRIADCQTANPSSSSWNGSTQCNGGQGLWRLVARSAANEEVWQDQRTGLLWSSIVNTAINWCRATGNTELTPLTFINSFNNTAGTLITGNGTIGALSSGTTSANETVTITFTSATAFTVSGANCGGGAITGGGLTVTAGSTVTWSRANYCSFTLTQGSTNFAVNDRFTLQSVQNSAYSCAPSGPLQPASPVSYCAEAAGLNAGVGDDWVTPIYMTAKGGLGKNSTPGVRWRSPSIDDYKIADANGIRFVMPDMGIGGASRPSPDGSVAGSAEWSSSVVSSSRSIAWIFFADVGVVGNSVRSFTFGARCVGR